MNFPQSLLLTPTTSLYADFTNTYTRIEHNIFFIFPYFSFFFLLWGSRMFFIFFSFNGILLYLSLKDDFNMQTCRESPFIHLFIQLIYWGPITCQVLFLVLRIKQSTEQSLMSWSWHSKVPIRWYNKIIKPSYPAVSILIT